MEYRIPAVNFPRLQEEIEKLNKRAKKLSLEPVKLTVVRTETVVRQDEMLGFDYEESFHFCTVEGEAPHLAGWRLIAAVSPVGKESLVREVPGCSCPEKYRNTDYHCDHCNSIRRRNAIFVLQHEESGEHKQVGRNCIADFLGTTDPESILGAAEYVFNFVKLASEAQEEGWGWSSGGRHVVPIQQFVRTVSIINRRLGYVSRSAARASMQESTADIAWRLCTTPSKDTKKFVDKNKLVPEEVDLKVAETALAWGAALKPEDAPSTYIYDLGVCCRQDHVTWDRAGFVSSVIQAYNIHLEREAKKSAPRQQGVHLGQVGQRERFSSLKIVSLKPTESQWGAVTKVHFMDESGNTLIWWASGCPNWLVAGETVDVDATVKKHSEFQGQKQTELSRVKQV